MGGNEETSVIPSVTKTVRPSAGGCWAQHRARSEGSEGGGTLRSLSLSSGTSVDGEGRRGDGKGSTAEVKAGQSQDKGGGVHMRQES